MKQRVLDLLKIQELDDYLKGVRGNENTEKGIEYQNAEKAILDEYNKLTDQAIKINRELEELNKIDINIELQAHKDLTEYNKKQKELELKNSNIARIEAALNKEEKLVNKLTKEIQTLNEHKCYACGQDFHDEQHNNVLTSKQELLIEAQETISPSLVKFFGAPHPLRSRREEIRFGRSFR